MGPLLEGVTHLRPEKREALRNGFAGPPAVDKDS